MTSEIEWKDIPNYTGVYQASRCGKIRRHPGNRYNSGRILKGILNHAGYRVVSLSRVGIAERSLGVHRMVMWAFVGVSDKDVNHINGIKTDNRLENLEYVTKRENMNHFYTTQGRGLAGVVKDRDRWRARIQVNYDLIQLGTFDTEAEAAACYAGAATMLNETKYTFNGLTAMKGE